MIGLLSDHLSIIGLGVGFGSICGGTVGWVLGYNLALRRIASWLRPQADDAYGDMPTLPFRIARDDINQTWRR